MASQLTNADQLKLNATTGAVNWENDGATLSSAKRLKVKATVTFTDLSVVEVVIPVTITTEK